MAGGGSGEKWSPERSAAGDRSPWLIIGIVSIATFMEVLDTSVANVTLDHIAGSVSASYDETTWVLTSYLIANAISIPISGWLSNIVGRKRFYMASVVVFTVSSLMCGLATNLSFLVFARILQGLGGGGLAPSEQSIITETFPPEKRAAAFAIYGLVIIAAPVLGPVLGGWITDVVSWHWVFLINVPVGILSLFLVHRFVVDPPLLEKERRQRLRGGVRIDAPGIILLILWLGCQEYVIDRGQREDWFSSGLIVSMSIVAATALVLLVAWEWFRKDPVFDVRLLARRSYGISILAMTATGIAVFGPTQIIPQYLQQVMGYTATTAGLAMTLGGIATVFALPVAGFLTNHVQPRYLMMFGLASEAAGLWLFTGINTEISFAWVATARIGIAIGLPFLFIPINTAAYADVPPERIPEASAQLNLARNLGGSIAIAIGQAMLEQRGQFHQSRLVETLPTSSEGYRTFTSGAQAALQTKVGGAAEPAAMYQLYETVRQQAQALAFIDVFWVLAVIIAAITPLLLLMKRVKPGQAPA